MPDVKAVREQLIAELDRTHTNADAKDAADRVRALRDLEVVHDEFLPLYEGMDLTTAHASVIDALGVQLRRASVALRAMQPVEGERLVGAAQDALDEQSLIPTSSVSTAADVDALINDGAITADTHRADGPPESPDLSPSVATGDEVPPASKE